MGSVSRFKKALRQRLGARHIVGRSIDDAVVAAQTERNRGNSSSLGYWPKGDDDPETIGVHLIDAIEAISAAGIDASISIKADTLGYDRRVLGPVLDLATTHGVRVHFDAQAHETADPTLEVIEWGLERGADISATLPARWARSFPDADRFIELGVPLRVVKGQAADPTDPTIDPRGAYLELIEHLAGRAAEVGVASHDRRVVEPALDVLTRSGTPCALEQLTALPRLDFLASKRGIPVRAYVAYGQSGLPYSLGQLFRRPAIVGWVLRDLMVRGRSE